MSCDDWTGWGWGVAGRSWLPRARRAASGGNAPRLHVVVGERHRRSVHQPAGRRSFAHQPDLPQRLRRRARRCGWRRSLRHLSWRRGQPERALPQSRRLALRGHQRARRRGLRRTRHHRRALGRSGWRRRFGFARQRPRPRHLHFSQRRSRPFHRDHKSRRHGHQEWRDFTRAGRRGRRRRPRSLRDELPHHESARRAVHALHDQHRQRAARAGGRERTLRGHAGVARTLHRGSARHHRGARRAGHFLPQRRRRAVHAGYVDGRNLSG